MTLRTKFFLYVVVPMVLLQGLVSWSDLRERRSALMETARTEMVRSVASAAHQIDRENRDAVEVARTMTLAQEAGMFGRREDSVALCRKVLLERGKSLLPAGIVGVTGAFGPGDAVSIGQCVSALAGTVAIDSRAKPNWPSASIAVTTVWCGA